MKTIEKEYNKVFFFRRSSIILFLVILTIYLLAFYLYDVFVESLTLILSKDMSYEAKMKILLLNFFTGKGLRLLVSICIILFLFFFFRARNYLVAIVIYFVGNVLVFFGPYLVKMIFK